MSDYQTLFYKQILKQCNSNPVKNRIQHLLKTACCYRYASQKFISNSFSPSDISLLKRCLKAQVIDFIDTDNIQQDK